jgi:hypothetical protein
MSLQMLLCSPTVGVSIMQRRGATRGGCCSRTRAPASTPSHVAGCSQESLMTVCWGSTKAAPLQRMLGSAAAKQCLRGCLHVVRCRCRSATPGLAPQCLSRRRTMRALFVRFHASTRDLPATPQWTNASCQRCQLIASLASCTRPGSAHAAGPYAAPAVQCCQLQQQRQRGACCQHGLQPKRDVFTGGRLA